MQIGSCVEQGDHFSNCVSNPIEVFRHFRNLLFSIKSQVNHKRNRFETNS